MFLVSCNAIISYLVTAMVFWLKLASYTASQNFPMEVREICEKAGKVWASLASSGSVVKVNQNTFVDFRIWSFGCFTRICAV